MDPPTRQRRPHRLLTVAVSALVLLAALAGPAATAPAGVQADGTPVAVVVGFHGDPDPGLLRRHGASVTDVFDLVPAVAATVPASALPALERHPAVDYVDHDEPVVGGPMVRSSADGGGQDETVPWGVRRVGAPAAHAGGTNGSGVTVAVLDSGIDADHPDLAGSYRGGVDLVNDDATPEDDHGHGTYVAGIVAAAADGRGVVGVAPGASIYAVKVLNGTLQGNTSDVVAGIEWAVRGPDGEAGTDDDADVVAMSLSTFDGPESLKAAVEAAYEDHDTLVVAAAGNAGELDYPDTVTFPGRYEEVVSVGAVNRSGGRPPWSGAGPRLELAAPGVDVLSTYPDGGQVRGEGTSAAAPHVAGVAALALASDVPPVVDRDGDEAWDVTELRTWLRATARDLGPEGRDDHYGHGRVDAAAAVRPPRRNASLGLRPRPSRSAR